MDLKGAFYRAATLAWMILVFGAWIYVDLGHAEPWLSFSDVPGGSIGAFAGALVATVAGWFVTSTLNERRERAEWQEAGRQAGLHPADDSGTRVNRN